MLALSIWQNSRILRLGLALAFGLVLLLGLLLAMGAAHTPEVALAQGPTIRYVDSASGNDSGSPGSNSRGSLCSPRAAAVSATLDNPTI